MQYGTMRPTSATSKRDVSDDAESASGQGSRIPLNEDNFHPRRYKDLMLDANIVP